jgi:hypothetical protein
MFFKFGMEIKQNLETEKNITFKYQQQNPNWCKYANIKQNKL